MKPEEVISPWRNAKPRKPLSDFNRSPGDYDVNSLSDDELYLQLSLQGVEVGPVVDSTRRFYRSRLRKILEGKNLNWGDEGSKNCLLLRERSFIIPVSSEFRI